MGVNRFTIVFNQPDKVYYPGQMVTGRVELSLNSILKLRGVELKVKGRAKCKWSETESYTDSEGKSQTRTVCHKESEIFLKNEIVLCGGREKFELPVGEHTFPFAVMLPGRAPSTFSGSYGGIAYYAKAKIDIPLAVDKTEKQGFTVVNLLNLNHYPELRNPFKNEKTKTFCCWCCASGPLTIVVHLPKTGFAKSESIPITLEIDNASNVAVSAVHAYLKRMTHWKAEGDHKDEVVQIQKLRFGAVSEGQSHTWSETLAIPPTSFPFLADCSIIKLSYELHVEADASGPHSDLDIKIPIKIGDIPLSEDPNAPVVDLNAQAFTNTLPYNQGMQVQPGGVPLGAYGQPGYPGGQPGYPGGQPGYPGGQPGYPGGQPGFPGSQPGYPGGQPGFPGGQSGYPAGQPGFPGGQPGVPPLQICPPAPPGTVGFVQPNLYPNAGFPTQDNAQQNHNPYPPGQPTVNQYPPNNSAGNFVPPPQPATNPECNQNNSNYNLPGFGNNDLKLEQTSFLSNTDKGQNENNASPYTPLLPANPSAPPPN